MDHHPVTRLDLATPRMCPPIDRHPAFKANAHSAQGRPGLACNRTAEMKLARLEKTRRNAHSRRHAHPPPVHFDRDLLRHPARTALSLHTAREQSPKLGLESRPPKDAP